VVTRHDPRGDDAADPQAAVELAESLELGFLIVLDMLGPVERAVFVLAEVFAVPYAEIAEVVDRSPEACRQVASRARRRVAAARGARRPVDEGLLGELVGAIALGRVDQVVELLAPGVVLTSDGGPRRHAARRPVVLPDRVARLLVNLATRMPDGATVAIEQVNCAPALVIRELGATTVLLAEREPTTGAIDRLQVLVNPDKLGGVDRPVELI
jgi:RNA polymerase sigma-70 factor (ECF subfamily)